MSERNRMVARTRRSMPLRLGVALLALFAAGCTAGGSNPAVFEAPLPKATPSSSTAVPTASFPAGVSPTVAAPPSVPPSLTGAAELLREGRFDEAARAYLDRAKDERDAATKAEALLGAGVARFEDGDREGAIEALEDAVEVAPRGSSASPRASYILALRLNEARRFDEAARVLRPLNVSETDPLAMYLAFEQAKALEGGGEPGAGWDRLLAWPNLPDTLRAKAYEARAEAAREAEDVPALAGWLDQIIALNGNGDARYERARLAREAGDNATWETQLRALVASGAGSSKAVLAIGQLIDAGLGVDAGQQGVIYYRRGAYQEVRRVVTPALAGLAASPREHTFAAYYLAAALEDSGQGTEAVRYYDEAASTGADSPFVHRARYWAARVTESMGDGREASRRYLALVEGGPAGEFTDEAAFRGGYVLLNAGDPAGAIEAWVAAGVAASARVEYWRARALEAMGDGAGAKTALLAAVAAGPLDFHGIEAANRLGQAIPLDVRYRDRQLTRPVDWGAIETWLAGQRPGAPTGTPRTAAAEMAGLGLRAEASTLVYEAAEGAGPWRLLELAREAHEAGLADVGARLAVRLRQSVGVPSHEVPKDLLKVAYPVSYVAQLTSASRAAGLDPLFVAAMVRQESFWDPAAGSPAGALGLTQVIPPTGEGIANALGLRFAPEDLFRPATSLRFGAYYLGGQVRRFGNPLIALAAYNAGPGNASRWQGQLGQGSAADLAEIIDFEETRNYVQFIVEHYAHYEKAWGD